MHGSEELARRWVDGLMGGGHALPVVEVDDGRIVTLNRQARELFRGAQAGDAVGEIFDPSCAGKVARLTEVDAVQVVELLAAADDGSPLTVTVLVLPGDVGQRLLVVTATRSHYPDRFAGQMIDANVELANLARELSRRKREIEADRERLEEAAELRELFIAAMAHDLRSPLSTIKLSEMALGRRGCAADPAAVSAHGALVERSVARMRQLIDGLLAAAELNSTELGAAAEGVELASVGAELASEMALRARSRSVDLKVQADGDTVVAGDPTWLSQVIGNLLDNAIRHAPDGTRVRIRITGTEATVRCMVEDRGAGVPPEQQEAIFERFRQSGTGVGAVGLGLYISKKIVELHGGTIWYEDNPGGGSRFCFEVPRRQAPASGRA